MSMTPEQRAGLFAITVTQFAFVFMLSALAVAVPALGQEFGAKAALLGLVESSYIASVAMLMLPVSRLADMWGRGFVFALGLAVFDVMSLLLTVCPSVGWLIFVRILQGIGAAMMVSTGLAILADIFPGKGRGRALGISTAGVYLGISAGPLLGGLITTHMGWRWIFYLGSLPCVVSLVMTVRALNVRPSRSGRGRGFDWIGSVLVALGMICLTQGGSHFADLSGKLLLAGGLVSLALFVTWEARADEPLLNLRLFAGNRSFAYGNLVQYINYASTFGITFLLSLYLQIVRGMSPGDAGLLLVAQPLLMAVLAPFVGNMVDRTPAHRLAAAGMFLSTLALAMAATLGMEAGLWRVVLVLVACGAGTALFATANMNVIMGSVGPTHYGVASAMVACMRTTGMTSGLVIISVALSLIVGPQQMTAESAAPYMTAMHLVLVCFVVPCALGVYFCLRAPERGTPDDVS
ncbi:MFS transporter [Desulfocurvus sp. DL9XJH121]